jgi:hypothetical protein
VQMFSGAGGGLGILGLTGHHLGPRSSLDNGGASPSHRHHAARPTQMANFNSESSGGSALSPRGIGMFGEQLGSSALSIAHYGSQGQSEHQGESEPQPGARESYTRTGSLRDLRRHGLYRKKRSLHHQWSQARHSVEDRRLVRRATVKLASPHQSGIGIQRTTGGDLDLNIHATHL